MRAALRAASGGRRKGRRPARAAMGATFLKKNVALGSYTTVRKLGEGQFAEVWEVRDAAGTRVSGRGLRAAFSMCMLCSVARMRWVLAEWAMLAASWPGVWLHTGHQPAGSPSADRSR